MIYETARKSSRLVESHSMLVRCLSPVEREGLHLIRDLGMGGCHFTSPHPFGLGARLDMAISVDQRVLQISGKVVREAKNGDCVFEVGVLFTEMDHRESEMLESLLKLEEFTSRDTSGQCPIAKSAVA